MKKFKKLITMILAVMITLTFTACKPAATFEYDEDTAIDTAKQVVETASKGDYEAVVNLFREDLTSLTTSEEFKEAWDPMISPAGAFVEYKDTQTAAQTDKKTGDQYIIVVLSCKYENSSLIYTTYLDTDMNIVGMYLK